MQTFAEWVQFSVAAAVVLLLLVLIGLVLTLLLKRAGKSEKNTFTIEHLNTEWQKTNLRLRSKILKPKAFEALQKEHSKKQKAQNKNTEERKRVFVVDFDGDISASRGNILREQVSALVSLCRSQDEVVVRIESAGGMVHAYGLAASQLVRLTSRNITVTACVDKVAASGGYMMACVANRIVAAPFAIIGSIGAVSSLPNFHRLLKKHDVDYIEQTAGEHKRTVSMFGEITNAGKAKHQEQLESIHKLFKTHVANHRPQVNIETVATGEYWPAALALEHSLVDEIKTSDDILLAHAENSDVYLLKAQEPQDFKAKLLKQFFGMIAHSKLPMAEL